MKHHLNFILSYDKDIQKQCLQFFTFLLCKECVLVIKNTIYQQTQNMVYHIKSDLTASMSQKLNDESSSNHSKSMFIMY